MNRDQAAQLVNAINALVPYCPPMLFERVVSSQALQIILNVANGQTEVHVKSPALVRDDVNAS
jgi:hypothetical protein